MDTTKQTKVALARKLGIARSSLYYKPKRTASDEELRQKVVSVMTEHPAYGHRRIAMALELNKKAIRRIMKMHGFRPKLRRGFGLVKLDDLGRPETRVPNILKVICPIRSNIVWAGDFTYLWLIDRFWYVATVIDVHTREILGWHIANHHTTSLIMEAFKDAARRSRASPTYFHSDQGSEYVSGAYESLLQSFGTTISHSRKSSPWQNGYQESFYNNFKLELGNLKRFNHVGELIEAVHGQIGYYNNRRIHTALRMPPVRYRELEEQKTMAFAIA